MDLRQVRADRDVLIALGRRIRLSIQPSCSLYSGLRGAGKTTELLRLKACLEEWGYIVVYFAADQDIDLSDTVDYSDILLACAHHILGQLNTLDPTENPLVQWVKECWPRIRTSLLIDIELEDLKVEDQLNPLTKLTTNLRAVPDLRRRIRETLEPYTVSLLDALNEFIHKARPQECAGILLIVDNLDRIVPIINQGRSNHEKIFLDQSGQLRSLQCHVIYTVPISLLYSRSAVSLRDHYDCLEVLPMVMTRHLDGSVYWPGLEKLRSVVCQRIQQAAPEWARDPNRLIFEQEEVLNQICLMSGGDLRLLMQLIQGSLVRSTQLPIQAESVQRALTEMRDIYRRVITQDQWPKLVEVARTKQIKNEPAYRGLLLNRTVLEYSQEDETGELMIWYDVHPLVREIPDFKVLFKSRGSGQTSSTQPISSDAESSKTSIYRYSLPKTSSRQERDQFQRYMEQVRQTNPNWILEPDLPRSNEELAFILISKDEDYLIKEAAYLVTRSLSDLLSGENHAN